MVALASRAVQPAGTTMRAAELACDTRFTDLPDDAVELVRQCILDTIGVTIAGADEPVVRAVLADAREQGGRAEASILGHPDRLPLRAAALVNGTTGHALDYDDCNLNMNGHVSVVVLPAVMAVAERDRLSGPELIASFFAGYETACRVGQTVAPGHYDRGFHATGTIGAIAAAAGSARALKMDTEQTANAIAIAVTMAAGLKGLFGTMCKPFHAGRAAENGLYAALLSRRGMLAKPDAIECRQGFADALAPAFHPDMVDAAPARGLYIRHNLFKYHAACYGTHGAIECGRLMRDLVADPDGIVGMTLEVAVENDKTCNIQTPHVASEARFSLRHCVAMAMAGIDTGSAGAYGAPSLDHPLVARLRELIEVKLVPGLDIAESRLTAHTGDGGVHRVDFDATIPESDIALQRRRLVDKFDALVTPVTGAARAAAIRDAILALDTLGDVSELAHLCGRA